MVHRSLFVKLKAKAGKEAEVAKFLAGALPLAQDEKGTAHWFALKFDEQTYGIFDTFDDDAGREAHLKGPIAAALMKRAGELLAAPPSIEKVDLLASKG
jgi:quinol monooxygenase YgiN